MMNAVGGSTYHYTAQFWRFHESDFKIRTQTVNRYGRKALPPGSAVVDWPLSYADLEPYYERVEYLVGVSGKGGANPFESPRYRDYPLPPNRNFGFGEMLGKAMRMQGYHPFPQPAAILSREYNGRPACTYCGDCTGYGCWNGSKSSMNQVIDMAEKTGKLEVRPNARVTRIMTDAGGHATGVEYRDASGHVVIQPAAFVILAGYAYENTRLLLLSTSGASPRGLSNNHGQVGKYYMAHSYPGVNGFFPGKQLNLFGGMSGQGAAMDDLNADNFDHAGLGFIRGMIMGAGAERQPIGSSRTVPFDVPGWGAAYKQWLRTNGNSVGSLGGQLEILPYEANFLDLDPTKKDPLGMPVVRITFDLYENEHRAAAYFFKKMSDILKAAGATKTWGYPASPLPINSHAFGGTRMGLDPAMSVVDGYSISHEVPNLAILGGSTFVSTAGLNPTCTIEALSWRSAEYIASNFNKHAV
jgi:gluconate 2-dehydrogenase alpha chain